MDLLTKSALKLNPFCARMGAVFLTSDYLGDVFYDFIILMIMA
jgi:hypothetical protein